ncbi:MAG: ParB N-terminal domain-containing protein [Nitrospinota bacterium]
MEQFETKMVRVKDLNPAPYNPRRISQEMLEASAESIRIHGFVEPIVADRRGWEPKRKRLVVVGGHQRLNLEVYPYLPRAQVKTTSPKAYLDLLAGVRP